MKKSKIIMLVLPIRLFMTWEKRRKNKKLLFL